MGTVSHLPVKPQVIGWRPQIEGAEFQPSGGETVLGRVLAFTNYEVEIGERKMSPPEARVLATALISAADACDEYRKSMQPERREGGK